MSFLAAMANSTNSVYHKDDGIDSKTKNKRKEQCLNSLQPKQNE